MFYPNPSDFYNRFNVLPHIVCTPKLTFIPFPFAAALHLELQRKKYIGKYNDKRKFVPKTTKPQFFYVKRKKKKKYIVREARPWIKMKKKTRWDSKRKQHPIPIIVSCSLISPSHHHLHYSYPNLLPNPLNPPRFLRHPFRVVLRQYCSWSLQHRTSAAACFVVPGVQ